MHAAGGLIMRISGFGSAAFGLIMAAGTGLPARAQTIKNMTTLGTYLRPGTVQASAGIWGWTGATAPAWAQPFLEDEDTELRADLAVWRAVARTDENDLRPAADRDDRIGP